LEPNPLPELGPRAPGARRALFVSHNLNLEGAPIFLLLLALGLRRQGYELVVLSPFDGALRARYLANGIPVALSDALRGLRRPGPYRRRMARLADWARRAGFDLVLANTLDSFWAVTVARLAGVPAAWAIHESVDWSCYFAYLPAPLRPIALECLQQADRLVFASDATRRMFATLANPDRLRRIHYGLDVDAIDRFRRERSRAELRAKHGVKEADRVVSIVGTTCERKGQLDFLRMARLLDPTGAGGIRFYVVGARPGDYLSRLESFARAERLESVVFVKATPDVYDYFRMSDLFVCASYEESLPIVILEAMAFELPIVSTDVFGIPEAVEHGREALLVAAGNVPALAAAVRQLLDDPALAARLGENARATFLRRFALERMAGDYDRLITELPPPVTGWMGRLYRRARRWGRRVLLAAPLPIRVREALWRLARAFPPPPPRSSGPPPYAEPGDAEYAAWLARHPFDPEAARSRLAGLQARPTFSIVLPVCDPEPHDLERALASVDAQLYPEWEVCIADDASASPQVRAILAGYLDRQPRARHVRLDARRHIHGASNAAIALARGEFLAFLDHDDELTPDALLEVAALLQDDPGADLVYSDYDLLSEDGRRRSPRFGPDWCPELLLSYMYMGHLKVYRTALVRGVGGFRAGFEGATDHDLALRLAERTDRIRHIAKILYHWRAARNSVARTSRTKPYSFESGRRAVEEAVRRRGIAAVVERPEFACQAGLGICRLRFSSAGNVPVTIVIPTRDRLDLLRGCIDSIEQRTTHHAYRILVLDNDSEEPATLAYLAASPHRVLRCPGPFNFSALVNRGVAAIDTELFVLLNNDTQVITPEWLEELVGYGGLPGVGAVGGKLLYADGRIQHSGVIVGAYGLAGHAFQPRMDTTAPLEYGAYAHVVRNYSAVTGACMLSRKSAFAEVGGFNERELAVAWNDVDYCLRLREKGYRVVFTPYALLYHLESQSRGYAADQGEIAYMKRHWKSVIDRDPYYNPNLSRRDGEFRLRTDPDEERLYYYR
jgi:glycosyltransferase involved in cell wall biosynthesis/GT2 family glycosyltransferase